MARILLVDDDADGLELRALLLAQDGHEIQLASTAHAARHRFAEFAPECVVLDLRLPEAETGRALIREFRAAAPGLRILVLTGERADLDGRSEHALADAVFGKPVRSEVLRGAVGGVNFAS